MEEYSELEAYKHLLSVAENIINSLQTDPNIVDKYNKLKSALMNKITNDPSSIQLTHLRKLLTTYKYVSGSLLEVISEFENQIEGDMERSIFSKKVIGVVKEWELRI